MNDNQLQKFYDIHKNGMISIRHAWTEKVYNAEISLENFIKMIDLIKKNRKRRNNE